MARTYGHQKTDLTLVLALVGHFEPVSRKHLVPYLGHFFDSSDRAIADALSILVQGHWLQRTRCSEDRRVSTYTLTERGRYIVSNPRGWMVLRVARKLFTTCPSERARRRQAVLVQQDANTALQKLERAVLVPS